MTTRRALLTGLAALAAPAIMGAWVPASFWAELQRPAPDADFALHQRDLSFLANASRHWPDCHPHWWWDAGSSQWYVGYQEHCPIRPMGDTYGSEMPPKPTVPPNRE